MGGRGSQVPNTPCSYIDEKILAHCFLGRVQKTDKQHMVAVFHWKYWERSEGPQLWCHAIGGKNMHLWNSVKRKLPEPWKEKKTREGEEIQINKTCLKLTIRHYSVYSPSGKMLTEYYRHQRAFSKSYCSRCLTSFGNISEKKYWRKTKSDLRNLFFFSAFPPHPLFFRNVFWLQDQIKTVQGSVSHHISSTDTSPF